MDSTTNPSQSEPLTASYEVARSLVNAASEALEIESVRQLRVGQSNRFRVAMNPSLELRGRLRFPAERAYDMIASRFEALGHLALLRRDRDGDVVLAVPGRLPEERSQPWLAIGLFVATLISVLWAGSIAEDNPMGGLNLLSGIPFALSLLGILLAHEFGHYLVARRLGVPCSLPYFIPLPISLFGTMGAMIKMKAPPRDRRKLFAVAIAGPLAGLVVALPILVVGLMLSPVQSVPVGVQFLQEGNSLLYAGIKLMLFGRFLPSGGEDVFLHPMALAGWAGLFVTGLNLIPASQLDGGHIVYALLGDRTRWITHGVTLALLALGVFWQGWLLWAGLVFLFREARATPLNDVTPLRPYERVLAALMIVVFVLTFIPIPMVIG